MDLMAAMPRVGVVMVLAGSVVAWRGIPEATAVAPASSLEAVQTGRTIAGTVGLPDGTPLKGVRVEGCGAETQTLEDGSYVLRAAQALPCVVTARFGDGFLERSASQELPVHSDASALNFILASVGSRASL